jgi:rare lipoprotein A
LPSSDRFITRQHHPAFPESYNVTFRSYSVLAALATLALTTTMAGTALAQNPAPAVTPAPPVVVTTPAAPAAAVPMTEKPAATAVKVPAAPAAPVQAAPMLTEKPMAARSSMEDSGLAAVYSDKLHGRKTASGKRYDRNGLTAAHKTLPFGTKVRVINVKNKRSVVLTITDRGPVQPDRVLDITPRAAKALGIHPRGMGSVTMTVISKR